MEKRKIDGYFINTYYNDNGVDFLTANWILNGRFYRRYFDKKTGAGKIKRISGREYQSEYEYHYNI